jgi:hypothetical protein
MPTILKTKNSVTTTVVPTSLQQGELAVNITDKKLWVGNAATTPVQLLGAGVTGDVVGPASATDNAVARFDATTGKLIQNSLVTVSDTGAISAPVDASISGLTVGKGTGGLATDTALGFEALLATGTNGANTAIGYRAGKAITSGGENVFVGFNAGLVNTSGNSNSFAGLAAGMANTTGSNNTAFGNASLRFNTTASNNTAVGYQAGYANTTGVGLTAVGYRALYNTTGSQNTAVGVAALQNNTTGTYNNAFGTSDGVITSTLGSNTTGSYNNAFGNGALATNSTGGNNSAFGFQALASNTTASNNTAVGYQAGYTQAGNANGNTLLGYQAGYTGNSFIDVNSFNTHVGYQAGYSNTTGIKNTFIGASAGTAVTTGYNNTILGRYTGNQGGLDIRTASNYIVLSDGDGNPRIYADNVGRLWCPGSYTYTTGNAVNLSINSNGLIERSTSSLKYKRDVNNATHGLAEVLQLRPVTYKGKSESDGDKVFGGLIAEEVDALGLIEFVQYADDGTPDALAYGNMVSLLAKAIQELNAKVEAQALEIATLKGN